MMRVKNRRRKRRGRRSSRRRNPMGSAIALQESPVRRVIPRVKDLSAAAGTLLVGTSAFAANHALGVLIDRAMVKANLGPKLGGATSAVKFAGRWIIARGFATYVFNKPGRGLLSATNGRFIVNLAIITGGLALLRDLGVLDKLPAQIQPYIPQLSAYEQGIHSRQLSGRVYGRRLAAYDQGIRRRQLAGYQQGVQSRQLSAYEQGVPRGSLSANYDDMPVETMAVPNYGVPFGA